MANIPSGIMVNGVLGRMRVANHSGTMVDLTGLISGDLNYNDGERVEGMHQGAGMERPATLLGMKSAGRITGNLVVTKSSSAGLSLDVLQNWNDDWPHEARAVQLDKRLNESDSSGYDRISANFKLRIFGNYTIRGGDGSPVVVTPIEMVSDGAISHAEVT